MDTIPFITRRAYAYSRLLDDAPLYDDLASFTVILDRGVDDLPVDAQKVVGQVDGPRRTGL
jgi:hypothetical protein